MLVLLAFEDLRQLTECGTHEPGLLDAVGCLGQRCPHLRREIAFQRLKILALGDLPAALVDDPERHPQMVRDGREVPGIVGHGHPAQRFQLVGEDVQQHAIREHPGMGGADRADSRFGQFKRKRIALQDQVVVSERLPLLEVHAAPVYVYLRVGHG